MRKIKLTNTQTTLLGSINLLIATHTPKPLPFLRNCLSYISHTLDTKFFGKQNTVHEASTIVTEEVRNHIIMSSVSLEDYSAVIDSIDQEVKNKIGGKSFLTNLCLQLEKKISGETKENYRRATEAFGDTEEIFSYLTATNSFNPGILGNYTDFIHGYINQSNSKVIYQEAKKVLSITCLLTPQSILLRGLARAVINIVNYNSRTVNSLESEQFTEFCTAISLNTTASTRPLREDTIRKILKQFAADHPIINWLLNTSNHFNTQHSYSVLYASMVAAFAIFITRIHGDYAVEQAQNDIKRALNNTQNITICRNRTMYEKFTNSGNGTFNNNGNNITVYAPDHVSQYFPQNEGWFNGMVEWIPCALRMTLLLFVLPRAFLSPVRKNYILQHYKSIELTPQQKLAHRSLVLSMAWRWACVASMQPGKIVTSTLNDQFFKWSVLRFIVPATFIEEAIKIETVANSHYKLSYRNTSSPRFHTPISTIYSCCAISLALEYISISISSASLPVSKALTIFTKLIRPGALILPLVLNRNRVQFSPAIKTVALASMVRLGATGALLPIFDFARGQLHWESLTSALLQAASVYSDRKIGAVMNTLNTVEVHLAIINPMVIAATQNHGSIMLLLPVIEQGQNREKYEKSIAEAAALLEAQVDLIIKQQQRRNSASIVEITDEEAEQIIREQKATQQTRQQSRSDLNASSGEVSIEFIQEEGNHQCKVVKFTDKCKHKPKKHRKHKDLPPSNSNENVALLSLTKYPSSSFLKKDDISTTNTTQTTVSTAQDRTPSSNVCAPTVYQSPCITGLTLRRHSI
ncbi:hypothetical protein FDZ64_01395 [Ehrlichia ruminantium]|uniref:Cpg1 family polymorphic protein n=1 Tax=Ehrlichia ruminantium TaxID=779 RepID=UPI0015DCF81C|nr:hypothetical protein [Ehrlichia ruminantium]QLK53088.1 hypothetical protein FDZ64_01395 [Ehrlichia ruminantium]